MVRHYTIGEYWFQCHSDNIQWTMVISKYNCNKVSNTDRLNCYSLKGEVGESETKCLHVYITSVNWEVIRQWAELPEFPTGQITSLIIIIHQTSLVSNMCEMTSYQVVFLSFLSTLDTWSRLHCIDSTCIMWSRAYLDLVQAFWREAGVPLMVGSRIQYFAWY